MAQKTQHVSSFLSYFFSLLVTHLCVAFFLGGCRCRHQSSCRVATTLKYHLTSSHNTHINTTHIFSECIVSHGLIRVFTVAL